MKKFPILPPLPRLLSFPFLTLSLAAVALLAHALPGWTTVLEFHREALAHGQLWRLFTGHFTHFTADHLRWDLLVFVALGALVELRSRRAFVVTLGSGALLISLGVAWLQPQFAVYRGLSGIDSALFAYIATDILLTAWADKKRGPAFVAGAALFLFLAKCVFEFVSARTLFVESGAAFAPVPLAHLLGALAGGVVRVCGVGRDRWARRQRERIASVRRNAGDGFAARPAVAPYP